MSVLWSTGLMRRATLEVVLVAILAGLVGVHLHLRRLSFLTMSIAHASFPGVVIAYWIGTAPFAGSLVFAAAFVVVLWLAAGTDSDDSSIGHSSLVGVALAGSLGLGAMLQSIQTRPPRNLASILTGSVVSVDHGDLVMTIVICAAVSLVLAAFHKELVYSAFDATGSRSAGFGRWLDLVVHLCVAVAVVSTVPALGTVLAPSLLIVPAMTARLWTERVSMMIAMATAFALAAAVSGLLWSTEQKIAAGPAITLVATGMFGLSVLFAPHGVVRHAIR